MDFADKSGNKFTNHSAMKSSNARLSAKMPEGGGKSVAALESPDGEAPEHEMGDDPHAVVQAHGPATEVHIMHSEGQHSVHSKHGDGHEHQDVADSAGEAHDMGKCLSGDCDCAGGM